MAQHCAVQSQQRSARPHSLGTKSTREPSPLKVTYLELLTLLKVLLLALRDLPDHTNSVAFSASARLHLMDCTVVLTLYWLQTGRGGRGTVSTARTLRTQFVQ